MRPFLLLMLAAAPVLAQGTSGGASFLKLPLTARFAALGETGAASSATLSAVAANPASAATGEYRVLLSHSMWIQDISTEHLAAAMPVGDGTLALTLTNTNIGDIEVRQIAGPADDVIQAHSGVAGLLFATPISEDITVGAGAKILFEKLYVDNATGYAADLGVLYRTPVEGLTAGFSLLNLGSMDAFRSEKVKLPATLRAGALFSMPAGNDLIVSFAADLRADLELGKQYGHCSVEAAYARQLYGRLGYIAGIDARSISAGLGVRYEFVSLDYAVVPFQYDLGTAHILTLAFVL